MQGKSVTMTTRVSILSPHGSTAPEVLVARRRQLALTTLSCGALALSSFSLGACVTEPEEAPPPFVTEDLGEVAQPIEGGYYDETTTHVVGLVRLANQGIASCSGTLIAPNVILTAQHCVADSSDGGFVQCGSTRFYPAHEASSFYVTTRPALSQNAADYHQVAEVLVPPGGDAFCNHDQALLILDEAIPIEEAVPATPRVDVPLVAGEVYDAVGFGQTGPNGSSGTRYRRDGLYTNCVGTECSVTTSAQEFEWVGEAGACQGDSGGPALDAMGRVAGVLSRGRQDSCDEPIYGHVFGWGEWIKEATAYGTSSRGIEIPPWTQGFPTDPAFQAPIGGACLQPADCPLTNACRDNYCTRPCNELAACDEGYVCADDGFCAEAPPPPASNDDDDDDGETTRVSCSMSGGKDPTKPIPWVIVPLALALRRRWRRG